MRAIGLCLRGAIGLAILAAVASSLPAADENEAGFHSIFNGTSFEGWKPWTGDEGFWRIEEGAITGESTAEKPLNHNTFLVWDNAEVDDFELRLQFRITGDQKAANSGIQFRGQIRPDGHVVGYQADIDLAGQWAGALYDEAGRGLLAGRGKKVKIAADGQKAEENGSEAVGVKAGEWHDYSITAHGNHITLRINGQITAEVYDDQKDPGNDPNKQADRIGLLALQMHSGPPQKVQFKNIRIKRLKMEKEKKVVFIAGRPSHGWGSHEHNAGCLLLAKRINESGLPLVATVYRSGWPKDPSALDNADTVVSYCDGGGGHYLNDRLEDFQHHVDSRHVGLVCIHYAVETTKGACGDKFLSWMGGYFEPHYSVNPHWTAKYTKFPDHPISRGVQPFEINDEWYFHMRFVEGLKNVTPILTDLPPRETMQRGDGPHSGNPEVRAAVLERKEPQHMGWAYERPEGKGRGFGFTGGHNHQNWQNDNFRKVVLNAIAWTAGLDVPKDGVASSTPSNEEMDANQDEPKPGSAQAPAPKKAADQLTGDAKTKAAATTPIVSSKTPNHSVEMEADVTGAKQLYLVVTDAGDGFGADWADWAEPRLIGPAGEKKLTELKWKSASVDWGNANVGQNAGGGNLSINGKPVEYGIGVHANSILEFDLPEGHSYTKFKVRGGLDNGGTNQGIGSTVQFHIFTQRPPKSVLASVASGGSGGGGGSRELTDALTQLDVGEGLEGSLFAGEPNLFNPTDIDIDHLGRVWVCEAVNYRHFANKGVIGDKGDKGDRIVIVEDSDHDGKADKTHVFFQGHEVDSAHGICVLPTPDGKGLRAIVSVGDKVWNFYDKDGDLTADDKQLMFSGIDGTQHDHGIHAFVFGPDGKLYFNFGNAGRRIKDKDGNPIVDKMGNVVDDSRKPYQEGMIFRCDLDGSNFETLAWNFRNNWEVTVDSFGGLWQSDNDDDGNRGVRINYVVEYGNYGYKDEKTGAGWQAYRTGWEEEIPLRHWHLNDPGVMPNMLQTGAGAPTGICLYEGTLLPETYRGQPIHCDAGPNVVRAYPAAQVGAGYTATMANVLQGARDNWFRPSDVCVAPDGSLIISDWYDPGVGGHRMGDAEKGRLFRVATPGSKYSVPKFDVSTAEGAIEALKSPNMAARYLGWQALHAMGDKAEAALTALWKDSNPRYRARALWLLGKQGDKAKQLAVVRAGLTDSDADIRCTAVRLARQLAGTLNVQDLDGALNLKDPSPAVRREILVGLRELKIEQVPQLPQAWAELALQYDGKDRWYLEALGIAAEGRWDAFLDAWKEAGGNAGDKAGRDILWRSRGNQTGPALAKIIANPATTVAELPRYFRAFDFLTGEAAQTAIAELAFSEPAGDAARQNLIVSEAITRLQGNIAADPKYKAALDRVLTAQKGTANFVRLIESLSLKDKYADLLELAIAQPDQQLGVDAAGVLLRKEQWELFSKAISGEAPRALATVTVLGLSNDGRAVGLLMAPVKNKEASVDLRRAAVKGLGNIRYGAQELAKLAATEGGVTPDIKETVAATLHSVQWQDIKDQAVKLYPLPPGKDAEPIPPLPELAKRNGDVANGRVLFNTIGTCNKCHIVNGIGRDVGPNLSEIGKKLSKQAMFESILYPSAGISHNYEQWAVTTTDGQVVTGLLVSSTDAETQIKDINGLVKTIKASEIEDKVKQSVSLMPADLQKLISVKEMTDIVEYLTTLKEAAPVEKK
jgi:putative membrane-bound dehydrogenase-like protein